MGAVVSPVEKDAEGLIIWHATHSDSIDRRISPLVHDTTDTEVSLYIVSPNLVCDEQFCQRIRSQSGPAPFTFNPFYLPCDLYP